MAKKSLKEEVYDGIYEDIINGKYEQDDILTESSLINHYKVSKSPVREALIELSKDGVLTSIPRVGYRIIPVTVKEIIDTLELRVCIEIAGLRKAYESIGEKEIEKLGSMIDDHRSEKDSIISNNWSRNSEFHTYLYSLNGNAYGYKVFHANAGILKLAGDIHHQPEVALYQRLLNAVVPLKQLLHHACGELLIFVYCYISVFRFKHFTV